MKLLLYCTKGKPLFRSSGDYDDDWGFNNFFDEYVCARDYYNYFRDYETVDEEDLLNGKIIAECDFEVEEISITYANYYHEELAYDTNTLTYDELLEKSCLNNQQLDNYLYGDNGYAIHIKNLNIFYKPKELSDYCKFNEDGALIPITKAPQNMMNAVEHLGEPMYVENHYIGLDDYFENYVLISIRPEWLCKILNGEKTVEVRKKVLKEML